MNQETMSQVVDKLAEKIGVAVDKIEPLAQQTVEQIQTRGMVKAIFCGVLLVALLICSGFAMKRLVDQNADKESQAMAVFVIVLLTFTFCLAPTIGIYNGLSVWVAPLPTLLGL